VNNPLICKDFYPLPLYIALQSHIYCIAMCKLSPAPFIGGFA
jgi:hypothetical protein